MPDIAYTVVWTPEAVDELLQLHPDNALDVLNNITALARTPYPPFSGRLHDEGLVALRVGPVSITYEVIGLTIRIIDIAELKPS
jgi:mRNA-degrading endonuclease RelE of RelBE toxin-antitoxin system